jgi:hypothetical protein
MTFGITPFLEKPQIRKYFIYQKQFMTVSGTPRMQCAVSEQQQSGRALDRLFSQGGFANPEG